MRIHGESDGNSGLTTPRLSLDDGRVHPGAWISLQDPLAVDTIAAEGFDWICIDGQHGGAEVSQLQPLIEAAHVFAVPTVVRVPGHDFGTAGRVLDAGASGIIFPTVENGDTAAALVAACRFPPRGKRSYGPTRRNPRYPKQHPGDPAEDALAIVMIETVDGLNNLDAILATGPDGILVGPYDLALGLGVALDELTSADEGGVLAGIARRAAAAGVTPGIYAGELSLAEKVAQLGYKFMPTASDNGLLAVAAREAVASAARLNPAVGVG